MHKFSIGLLLLLVCTLPTQADEIAPKLSRAKYVIQKVAEADVLCEAVRLTVTTETDIGKPTKDGKHPSRITERPVALCAFSEHTKTWHVILVHLAYPVPKEYIACVRGAPTIEARRNCVLPHHVVTPGYHVDHLRGYGITRLIFDVYKEEEKTVMVGDEVQTLRTQGEKLTVYRTRHMWLDDDALSSGDVSRIIATARGINYTPYHLDFSDPELVEIGTRFLYEKVQGVRASLGYDRKTGVPSRAFPEQALARVVPWETPVSLAVIEQLDDKMFRTDKRRATEAVFAEYAINGDEAFRYSQSSKDAIGPLQFTNGNGNGTYSGIVREYPGAMLDPSFESGARDLGNVLRAAIALIDYEVAQFPEIKPIYKKNPKLGGAFPVAAYNGGPPASRALYAWLKKYGRNIEQKSIILPESFLVKKREKCPCKDQSARKGKTKRVVEHIVVNTKNTETPLYLEKYLFLLNYLADTGLE